MEADRVPWDATSWQEKGIAVGSKTGFGLGALPGVCLGASVFGLVGAASGGMEQAREAAIVGLQEEEPAETAPKEDGNEWSSAAGAAFGSQVIGAFTGASLGVPLALIGGVTGGILGLCLDVLAMPFTYWTSRQAWAALAPAALPGAR
mmetsp:Transcript_71997/g.163429  ORF Transcript_71997/g.163429 Transcript_71997/m.163429 type:complete len:148 (+) Transcript_71997:98-541(+)